MSYFLLFAKSGFSHSIQRYFRNVGMGMLAVHVAIILCAAGALWLGMLWVERFRTRRMISAQTPEGLFWELCLAHRLSRAERAIAQAAAPTNDPCRVFIDRSILDKLGTSKAEGAGDYAELARRLFGSARE